MYGYVGYVLLARVRRTKVRKGLGCVSYSLVYSVPGIKKKKVHIRGLGRILISRASESEISETEGKTNNLVRTDSR